MQEEMIVVTLNDIIAIAMFALWMLLVAIYYLIVLISAKRGKIFKKKSDDCDERKEDEIRYRDR
jgi:hypothetical protein